MESDDALSGFASKMKFQMVAEKLIAVATYAVQRQPFPESAECAWNHVFGWIGLR